MFSDEYFQFRTTLEFIIAREVVCLERQGQHGCSLEYSGSIRGFVIPSGSPSQDKVNEWCDFEPRVRILAFERRLRFTARQTSTIRTDERFYGI